MAIDLGHAAIGEAYGAQNAIEILAGVRQLLRSDAILLVRGRRLVGVRLQPRLHVTEVLPERRHIDDQVLDHAHGAHGRDTQLGTTPLQLRGDRSLADQLGVAIDHHGAGATNRVAAGAPEGERVVLLVLDGEQAVEDGRLVP